MLLSLDLVTDDLRTLASPMECQAQLTSSLEPSSYGGDGLDSTVDPLLLSLEVRNRAIFCHTTLLSLVALSQIEN